MRFRVLTVLFLLIPLGLLKGQINYKKRAANYFKVRNFERALGDYEKLHRQKPGNTDYIERIIDCYLLGNLSRNKIVDYVEKLQSLKPNHPQINWFLTLSAFYTYQLDSAGFYLEKYLKQTSLKGEASNKASLMGNYINNAKVLIMNPVNVSFINLGEGINSNRSEINPFVLPNDSLLFFSSDKRFSAPTGINYYNIGITVFEGDDWGNAKNIGSKVNSMFDEITAGLSPATNQLFVFHNRYGEPLLASAQFNNGLKFDELDDLQLSVMQKGAEYGASVSSSGDTLYFAGDVTGSNTDIWFAIRLPNGNWGEPRLLPGLINSPFDENFPQISPNGKTLRFASNGKGSMGGYDIFESHWVDSLNHWGVPVNLGYPINDVYDNFTLSVPNHQKWGYVSAIRQDGFGLRDIYKVVFENYLTNEIVCRFSLAVDASEIQNDWSIVLWDNSMNNIIGTYRYNTSSGLIIVAVASGNYVVQLTRNGTIVGQTPLNVPVSLNDVIDYQLQFDSSGISIQK